MDYDNDDDGEEEGVNYDDGEEGDGMDYDDGEEEEGWIMMMVRKRRDGL